MTVAFVQEELSICLDTAPKEVLVFLVFPIAADPNRRECPGKGHHRSLAECWQKCDLS